MEIGNMKLLFTKVAMIFMGLLLVTSCSSSDPVAPEEPSLKGSWGLKNVAYETGIQEYGRLEELAGDQNGYQFADDGELTVRNFGWCATPPLFYFNFPGSWQAETENNVLLTYPHLGGEVEFRLEVISLDKEKLICRIEMVE